MRSHTYVIKLSRGSILNNWRSSAIVAYLERSQEYALYFVQCSILFIQTKREQELVEAEYSRGYDVVTETLRIYRSIC